jgi:hypothetical protein
MVVERVAQAWLVKTVDNAVLPGIATPKASEHDVMVAFQQHGHGNHGQSTCKILRRFIGYSGAPTIRSDTKTTVQRLYLEGLLHTGYLRNQWRTVSSNVAMAMAMADTSF